MRNKGEVGVSWRLFVPTLIAAGGLLWFYSKTVVSDISESKARYVQAGALFLNWLNSQEDTVFLDCRKAVDGDRKIFSDLREGDVVLVGEDGEFIFPMSVYIRSLHRSPSRTEVETLLHRANLSVYSLPSRSCHRWPEILATYEALNSEEEIVQNHQSL